MAALDLDAPASGTMAPAAIIQPSRSLKRPRLSNADYKIAFLVPLGVELAPLRAMLDAIHEDIPTNRPQNAYILGEMSNHNVVIAILPAVGNNDSGVVAAQLKNDFPYIGAAMLVGIAGGIPSIEKRKDIRLGDVVVSEPTDTTGGVLQFDRGKRHSADHFQCAGHLGQPSRFLIATVKKLKAQHLQEGSCNIQRFVSDMIRRNPHMKDEYSCPGTEKDFLYEPLYEHVGGDTCQRCDPARTILRSPRSEGHSRIHYGAIGSSNAVLRDAVERDRLGREHNILCVEMEAAGIMNVLPCLVIRGICDYADSHKNKTWQPYSAAVAAAYAKELLQLIPSEKSAHVLPVIASHGKVSTPHQADVSLLGSDAGEAVEPANSLYHMLLESLVFSRMDARLRNVADALRETCKWLFLDNRFQQWTQRLDMEGNHGFLWIKGKPGSGKSTMMKTMFRWSQRKWKNDVNVSYFFNARAPSDLEKSSFGFYRSLAHQLLCLYPQLKSLFLQHFRLKVRNGTIEDWTPQELKDFINTSIPTLLDFHGQPLNIFVDALDEGDEADVRQMIDFLEDLASHAWSSQFPVRICLSSRHFPYITIKRGITLVMEKHDGHKDDIRTYVHVKLPAGGSTELMDLKDEIFKKSNGIFLWVVLVVRILNAEHDHGATVKQMTQSLQNLPEELDELFTRIINDTNEASPDCVSLLQWVLFSRRALSPIELSIALQSCRTPALANQGEYSDERPESAAALERYFLNTSRGLTEVTKVPPFTVQFIHETVRDFLRRKGLSQIDMSLQGNIEGLSHNKLKEGCLRYVQACSRSLPDGPPKNAKAYHQGISKVFFFIDYAADHLFGHAELAASFGQSQMAFLGQMHESGSTFRCWVRARNAVQDTKVGRYNVEMNLLYVLVEQSCVILLQCLFDNNIDIDIDTNCGRYGSALQAASAAGAVQIADLLIKAGANINAEGGEFKHALLTAIHFKREPVIRLLVDNHAQPSPDALRWALFKTIARGYLEGVQWLLKVGGDVNWRNQRDETMLYFAVKRGPVSIVELLIQKGADVNTSDGPYSALCAACQDGNEQIARLLLEKGADINARGGKYGSALQAACRYSNEQIVRLLLENGADVNATGGHYGSALQAACGYTSNEQIVRLLLENGADVNATGGHYGSALQAACKDGDEQIVRILIEKGADVNTTGGHYGSALQAACRYSNEQITRLLLDKGADVNATGGYYGSAPQVACFEKHTRIARMLRDAGALA